jgi:hypothetical protein
MNIYNQTSHKLIIAIYIALESLNYFSIKNLIFYKPINENMKRYKKLKIHNTQHKYIEKRGYKIFIPK